jgi:hypothetical protein
MFSRWFWQLQRKDKERTLVTASFLTLGKDGGQEKNHTLIILLVVWYFLINYSPNRKQK